MEKYTILSQLVLPNQANPNGNIHGGEIMKMMDSAAAVAAARYSRSNVVTARVDEMNFRHPIFVGDYVMCGAHVIYTGHTSMEVFVTVESENLKTGKHAIAQTAFFSMVAVDDNGVPNPVPMMEEPDDAYDKKFYIEAKKRYEQRKERGH